MRIPYFAYGSNMAPTEMGAWCEDHRALGPARLDGFRLAFLRDSPRWLAGAADIVPGARGRRDHVWGVLWEVSPADLAALDRKERAHLVGYRRRRVDVRLRTAGGPSIRAVTYVVIQRRAHELTPAAPYLELMLEGARANGLPAEWIAMLTDCAGRLKAP